MRKFTLKMLLFFSPVIALIFIEIFLLPLNFFTHRSWEALAARDPKLFIGPFYPMKTLFTEEEGDLAYRTPHAVKKSANWVTDEFGFRKYPNSGISNKIVIIGESSVVGSSLDQKDTLAEQLEQLTKQRVYPYAPKTFVDFIRDTRFKKDSPDVVILAISERVLPLLPEAPTDVEQNHSGAKTNFSQVRSSLTDPALRMMQNFLVPIDRISKSAFVHFSRARLHQTLGLSDPFGVMGRDGKTFFLKSDNEVSDSSPTLRRDVVRKLTRYQMMLNERSIQFLFVAIPDKSTIYHDRVPVTWPIKKSDRLKLLSKDLTRSGVANIDLQTAFEETYEKRGLEVYQPDDTHWNELGVKITSQLLFSELNPTQTMNTNAKI